MVNAIAKARERARNYLEAMYEGTCTVIERQHIKDPVTKIKRQEERVVLEGQPCRLSFKSVRCGAD